MKLYTTGIKDARKFVIIIEPTNFQAENLKSELAKAKKERCYFSTRNNIYYVYKSNNYCIFHYSEHEMTEEDIQDKIVFKIIKSNIYVKKISRL